MDKKFLEVINISKNYEEAGKVYAIMKDIKFEMKRREFVCLVGPSGCGKSTLLRIISGLEKPSSGRVMFEGEEIKAENPHVANVFQNFGLLPWLTVEQNVALGLEALKFDEEEKKKKVEKYLKMVGLTGSKNAYPRELSGGMKQRVGLARALAIEPKLLCMDEPFSSLDALTAENLRQELLLLWEDIKSPPESVLMVTHNIEEAVYLADRIIVLSGKPTRIMAFLKINMKRPRDRKSQQFYHWVDKVYSLIT